MRKLTDPIAVAKVAVLVAPVIERAKERRVARLNDLSPEQRRVVLALIDAKKSAEARRAMAPEVRVVEV